MPHARTRHAEELIKKLAKLWPIIGILGLRQVGKTTLLKRLEGLIVELISLDLESYKLDAERSAQAFLGKLSRPTGIDEIQKVPSLFDALKWIVDQKRIPGQFFITGSSAFSSKAGIQESLTGRIGMLQLYPMTLSEIHSQVLAPLPSVSPSPKPPRFNTLDFSITMVRGGMPIPCFLRDEDSRSTYWQGWLETTLYRDLSRVFKGRFDPELAHSILNEMAKAFREGLRPTLKNFSLDSRKLRKYLEAMEQIFLVRRTRCHELGYGTESWMLGDSGLACSLMEAKEGEGATLTLVRHCLLNELGAIHQYRGKLFPFAYYQGTKGTIIDLFIGRVPVKIVTTAKLNEWDERSLAACMKRLKVDQGILCAPVDKPTFSKKGISIVPWTFWS